MKILIVSQYFFPEEFKVNDLAEELVRRGHKVTVLTGKPNYPQGKYYDGYKFGGIQCEDYKGAKVIRVPLVNRGKGGTFGLLANYLSYVLFGCAYAWVYKLECDAVICFETSPITQIYPAFTVRRRTRCKVAMWVQDLWPESVVAAGPMGNGVLMRWLTGMVRNIYRRCDVLFVQSKAFEKSICAKGDFQRKIVYAPNWAEDLFRTVIAERQKYQNLMPNGFIVMFAGNIGEAQDFDALVEAALRTQAYPQIKWVVVGDGRRRKAVEAMVKKRGLEQIMFFLGRYPVAEMPHFFVHADVMVVSLKSTEIFALTIPSKIQSYMAFGKPIATMLDGMGSDIVQEAECGLTAPAGDAQRLADNVVMMSEMDETELARLGQNGYAYYAKHFEKEKVVSRMLEALCDGA